MNVFQNAGIGLGSNFNRRRTRDARDSGGGGGGSGSSTIVAITDKQTKSLLRERDAKIAALEKEVLTLKNKISGLSINNNNNSMLMVGQRTGKKGLTPYGNTVRVSTSKCSAKRRQVSICGCACFHLLPLNHSLTLHYIQHCIYRLSNTLYPTTASRRTSSNGPQCLHRHPSHSQLPPR